MVRGLSLFAVIVVVLIAGVVGRPARQEESALALTGDVRIVTAPDGKTTAVTFDGGEQMFAADGVVDHAFRLYHRASQGLVYDGPATIEYVKGRLTVRPTDRAAWVFFVADDKTAALEPAFNGTSLMVTGLTHHWGRATHRSPDDVAAGLLAAPCSRLDGDPACEDCEAGGPGATGCGVECDGGSGCSAKCGDDSMACCSCAHGCGCCPPRETRPLTGAPK